MRPIEGLLALSMATPALAQSSSTTITSTPDSSQTTVTSNGVAAATTTITTTPKGTTVKTTAADPKTKMICQYTDTLGTRLGGHKVCMTREQWRQNALDNRTAVDHVQNSRGFIGN